MQRKAHHNAAATAHVTIHVNENVAFVKAADAASCIPTVSGREITTITCAEENGICTDVLIRADGGIDWRLSGRVFPRTSLSPDQVVVADIVNNGNKRSRRTAQRQRTAYRDRGWRLIDED